MTAIEEITDVRADGTVVVRRPELKPGETVKAIVLMADSADTKHVRQSKLTLDWAGGLSDLATDYTSVELQHKAQEWR